MGSFIIYRVICLENGKVYVGKHQTEDLDDGYLGSGKMLRKAIEKYGADKFKKEILHVFETEEEMNAKEAELVTEEFCARDDTYNLCPGGKGGWGYVNQNGLARGWAATPKARKNTSEKGRTGGSARFAKHGIDAKWLKAGQDAWRGKKHSSETKEKMRKNHNPLSHPRGPRGPYKRKQCVAQPG